MRRNRHPEPFWRASRNCFFVQIGRKQIKLHPDRDEAYRLYHKLMSQPPEQQALTPYNPVSSGQVVELLDAFLKWCRKNKAPRTYSSYKDLIQIFVDSIPRGLPIAELKPYHVTCTMDKYPHWGNNTRHDFIFPPKQAKGEKYYRTIYLTERARRIVTRLTVANPMGPLLVNSEGNAWTKDAVNCAFCRLEKKIGSKYHLGAFRKGYATEALKAGVDTVTVAHLLGHRDPSMISKVYGQVQQDPEHMAKSARKAKKIKKLANA